MTDLILPERMAKARRKQKAKIDEEQDFVQFVDKLDVYKKR